MRIIDADTLKESVSNSPLIDFDDYAIFQIIDKAPTVTIKEWNEEMPIYIKDAMLEALRPQGEWLPNYTSQFRNPGRQCSLCGKVVEFSENFCPKCGAYMRGNDHERPR